MKIAGMHFGWVICATLFSMRIGLASEPNNVSPAMIVSADVMMLYAMSVIMPLLASSAMALADQRTTFEERVAVVLKNAAVMLSSSAAAMIVWAVLSTVGHAPAIPRYILGIPAIAMIISFTSATVRRNRFATATLAALSLVFVLMCITLVK